MAWAEMNSVEGSEAGNSTWLPARRAASVDPASVLRSD